MASASCHQKLPVLIFLIASLKTLEATTNKCLEVYPQPPDIEPETSLIWYKVGNKTNVNEWTKKIDNFLNVYKNHNQNQVKCDHDTPPPEGKFCKVPVDKSMMPCVSANDYNYHKSAPCIFLTLNKNCDWKPEFYNGSDSLPENMPSDLKHYVRDSYHNSLWVYCDGENPADDENIGPIQYIPRRGFPAYFFPIKNADGYLSPVIAIFFERPVTGIIISVKCSVWAKNIPQEQYGSVKFELLID